VQSEQSVPVPEHLRADGHSPSVGARVRGLRRDQQVTLRELARRIGVSAATVSQMERGHTGMSVGRLMKIADALGIPVVQLMFPDGKAEAGLAQTWDPGAEEQTRRLRAAVESARRSDGADWRAYPPLNLGPVLTAALAAFLESGYGGASVRDIAKRCDLSVPGLYHHYASKQDMLVDLLEIYMGSVLWRTAEARAEGHDSAHRFALLIECLALHHTYRRAIAFVGLSEMRSLEPANRRRILTLRNRQQRMVDDEAEQAHRLGQFATPHPHDASRAVVTMCTSIPHWYRPEGAATPEEIASMYVRFALDLMRCTQVSQ
jgi:AcrR family transcriptional regulator/transcriptional regulator with XRE-family HTH domain